ncbi:hypothetical protein Tco_0617024 [Tanacetum coccineum]
MSDSEHSTITYLTELEYSDMGSPGVDGPPSPDYVPGPEAPPSPIYIPYLRSSRYQLFDSPTGNSRDNIPSQIRGDPRDDPEERPCQLTLLTKEMMMRRMMRRST